MQQLFENIMVEGLETDVRIFLPNNMLEEMSFMLMPEKIDTNNLAENNLLPFLFTKDFSLFTSSMLELEANIYYSIQGKCGFYNSNTIIYLSVVEEGKTLRETIKYTMSGTELQTGGNFVFPNKLLFPEKTSVAVWTELEFQSGALSEFYAKAIPDTAPGNFIYTYKNNVIMPTSINDQPVSQESTYNVYVTGTLDLIRENSLQLNITLLPNSDIPDEYFYPDDGVYSSKDTSKFVGNVNKGIAELDAGILIPDPNNIVFQNFLSSLIVVNDFNQAVYTNDINFNISTSWGAPDLQRRVLLWISTNDDVSGSIIIENLGGDNQGELDGIYWSIVDVAVCLSGETLISMADGTFKKMRDIKVKDMVLDKDGKETEVTKVEYSGKSEHHILYYFEDGTIIDETGPHSFFNCELDATKALEKWKIGEHALNEKNKPIALIKKEKIEESAERFGIWTESNFYYANGLLSCGAVSILEQLGDMENERVIELLASSNDDQILSLLGG